MKNKEVVCYAHSLGGCSDVQSSEHYFTQGMFASNLITVSGQSWLRGQAKEISKKTLGLKILCQKHNKDLGLPVDLEAIRIFRILDEYFQRNFERSKLPRWQTWKPDRVKLDGFVLEKWAIKYLLGAVFEDPSNRWHPSGAELVNPPIKALDALFNGKNLKYPMGLYHTNGAGKRKIQNEERLGIGILYYPEKHQVVGGSVNFRNLLFTIWLCEEELSDFEYMSDEGILFGPEDHQEKHQYHMTDLNFHVKGKLSGTIEFDWGE